MAYDFNAADVFEMAEQMEANGAKFYRSKAQSVDNENLADLLNHLANMEIEHQQSFKAMKDELSSAETASTIFDPEGESTLYLKSLVEARVSFEHNYQTTSIEDILKSSIQSEKDTIAFYVGMKDAVPEPLGKSKIDKIIKEEMEHIRVLTDEMIKLRNS